ncbi:MAG: glycerate kinase [Clostridia bacterium]|nr:glycerate kinase [Clostridia bacterium]
MNSRLRSDAEQIVRAAIDAVRPDEAVRRALENVQLTGRITLVAVGKAAWRMANAALANLDRPIERGIVITKYGHVMGALPNVVCFEAGHPVSDANSYAATQAVLEMTANLSADDTVLFLLSGGGSALFELPLIDAEEYQEITKQLLASGADIVEMNTIRKRLSAVKGGRFALHCAPARIEGIVLSDVLGDPLDMIASGPASPDPTTAAQAAAIARKYSLPLSDAAWRCLQTETPKEIDNAHLQIIGSVRELCRAAEAECRALGYEPIYLTDRLCCEAKDAGSFLASILKSHENSEKLLAFITGGETVVHVTGRGLGGRNQELALAAAKGIAGMNAAVISVGSDGTDGPTDAAGGYVDGDTLAKLCAAGIDPDESLASNDAYHALQAVGGLIFTGPTGTNVNDVTVALLG